MRSHTPVLNSPEIISRELDELDRLLHRIRSRLMTPASTKVASLSHWRKMRGALKGKIVEDPTAYQKRIRKESERYSI